MSSTQNAEIFDRGYRAYDGPRTGVNTGMKAVGVATVQRALGMRRKFRFKIVPMLTTLIAYVPALAFMGIAILLPSELAGEVVPEYSGYYGLISITMILLTAFVVPEVMGSDRRTGLFGLYMASPLTRWHYLAAKFLAILGVLSLVTFLPSVFQLVGYSFLELGPDGFVEILETLGKIFLSGLILSVFFALLGMAAATLTNRHVFASAGIVLLIVATGVFTGIIGETTEAPEWIGLFSLLDIPLELILRLWGEPFPDFEAPIEGVSNLASFGVWAGACAIFAAIVIAGYHRLEVTK